MKQSYYPNPTLSLPIVGKQASRWLAYGLSLIVVFFSLAMSAKAQVRFASSVDYPVGNGDNRFTITKGDFNADGKIDLVSINRYDNNISVLLGTGIGTFTTQVPYNVTNPYSVAIADFNGDAKQDLAVTSHPNQLNILLGVGDGTFGTASIITLVTDCSPIGIVLADFNGDSKIDIATANNYTSNNTSILFGVGDGTFGVPSNYSFSGAQFPENVASGDFDRDGDIDLVFTVIGNPCISVRLNSGTGTFATGSNYLADGSYLRAIVVADINNDGKLDLVVGNDNFNVNTLLGNGNGTFQTAVAIPTTQRPYGIIVADFDGDNQVDLVYTNDSGNSLEVRLGIGMGTFGSATTFSVNSPIAIASGDFNGDGKIDLVTRSYSSSISVLINTTTSRVRGNMMSFDGTNDQVVIPDNTTLQLTNAMTLEGWVNLNSFANEPPMITKNDDDGYILWLVSGQPACRIGGNGNVIVAPALSSLNTWYHIAVTYNGAMMTMYVNGVQVATAANTASASTVGQPVRLGKWEGFGRLLNGKLDEIRIWNIARTQTQIRESMHLTLSGLESGLVAYYQFNETAGNAPIDEINGNNGALVGGAIQITSTVSVAKGVSNRQTVNATGNYDFTGTGCSLNFTGTLPAGEVVVNRLAGEVYGTQLGGNMHYSRYYWVINNYGTNTGLTVTPTFVLGPNMITTGDATNLRLNKRVTNNGGGWTTFNGITATISTGLATFADIDSFSEFGVGGLGVSPLPITLLGLKGERVEKGGERTAEVKLTWTTAQEIGNKGFEVEMSDNGLAYEKIAFVEGKGNSTTIQPYSHITIQPYDSYYRLKQVDFDGTLSYSPVVFVEGLVGKVVVYPNPSNGTFTVLVGKDKLDSPARLLNAQGVEVWKGMQTEVRATNLPAGIYFLHTVVAGKTKITKISIKH